MSSKLYVEIKARRDLKGLKQVDIATHLGMPVSTYSKKEREGDFTEAELGKIGKMIGVKKETLVEFANHKAMDIHDSVDFLARKVIQLESMNRVLLSCLAELLAAERSRATKKEVKQQTILTELANAVDRESEETVRLYEGGGPGQ